ncbi:unnamed protein product [Owenia fusiformis]|uniref:Dynein axonemal intermediate chain 4 n=1 Tax=Owenia fusiformis TaxID=6347 RepID=A0A8J1YB31_OWEFU|nr:unnamed protein product [Owenia fusiformis]
MSQHRKSLYPGGQGVGASTASRKSNQVVSVASKSRVGGGRQTTIAGSRTTVLSSGSRRKIGGSEDKASVSRAPVQVIDETGADVTPLPLLHTDPNSVRQKQSNLLGDGSIGTPTDLMSQASIYQTGTVSASTFGGGPFTRSVFSQSQSGASESVVDDIAEPAAEMPSAFAQITHVREDVKEELTESDLEKMVDIKLTETDTIWMLDMPGVCVPADSDEAVTVKEQNELYKELCKTRVGNDRYVERGVTTFNEPPKLKVVQTTRINHNDIGIMATTWDMYDTYKLAEELEKAKEKEAEDEENEEEGEPKEEKTDEEKKDDSASQKEGTGITKQGTQISIMKSGLESQGTMMSTASSIFGSKESGVSAVSDVQSTGKDDILKSDSLRKDLFVMERVVNNNTYQPKQACYRGFDIIPDIDKVTKEDTMLGALEEMGPNLDRLWSFSCPLTKGRNVSCMSWNRANPDLVAIGYSQFEFTNQKGGLICCWSLKNPEYPERIYTCSSGVTAMDFSTAHANLLAVGLYDGTVAVYNVRNTINAPILDSLESSGKHTGPVWQLSWIEKERGSGDERMEVLVSISTDGRVTQWYIRKGFECADLMRLKRVTPKQGAPAIAAGKAKEKKGDALIARQAGGMCFDFSAKDSNIYLAGTEEGHIHKCSCSYNEQYLESFFGHTGPVYKIQWSPFIPDVFLSCSADWSIRLWLQDRLQPVLNFFSSTKAVHDMCWSPRSSTVFACVNEGAVEVWDLSQSTLDPIIVNTANSGVKFSSVSFSRNSESILVGDSEGQVTAFQLRCMPKPPKHQADALHKIIKSSLASQMQGSKDTKDTPKEPK